MKLGLRLSLGMRPIALTSTSDPSNALTLNSQALTLNGQTLTLGV